MIGAVAHEMGERILDQFEHLAVELGLGAAHFKFDLLAEFGAQIAHDARQFLPRIADRLHARLHHAFLKLGGDVGQPLQRHLEIGIFVPAHDLEKLVARQHQLRDRGHQMIERVDADADRMVGECLTRLGGGLSARFERGLAGLATAVAPRRPSAQAVAGLSGRVDCAAASSRRAMRSSCSIRSPSSPAGSCALASRVRRGSF